MLVQLEQCVHPAQFYRLWKEEWNVNISANIRRDQHVAEFVVDLLVKALASTSQAIPKQVDKNGNADADIIILDSSSSSGETVMYDPESEFDGTYLLPPRTKILVERILHFASHAKRVRGLGLDTNRFTTKFIEKIEFPPLELLWILDSKFSLMSTSAYVIKLHSAPSSKLDFVSKQIINFYFSFCLHGESTPSTSDTNAKRAIEVANFLLRNLVIYGYCNPVSEPSLLTLKTVAINILTTITKKLIDTDLPSSIDQDLFVALIQNVAVVNTVKRRYFSDQLLVLLTLSSTCQTRQTLTDVLQYQEKFACTNENQKKLKTISSYVGLAPNKKDVMEVLRTTLNASNRSSLSWENVLHTLTVWEKTCIEAASEIFNPVRDLIRELISIGLNEEKEDELLMAFTLARHCCLISSEGFSPYDKWFSSTFEQEKSMANTCEKFTFLIQTLTKWIPIEPPTFLQIHVTFSCRPFTPTGCRDIWSNYRALARVRITEYLIIESALECDPTSKDPVEYEVDMAVKEFDSTNKIPKSVSQMLFYQRDYYLNQFLPTLFKQPSGAIINDARFRLIEALNTDGKIPAALYLEYKHWFQRKALGLSFD